MIIGELDRYIKAKCKEMNYDVLLIGQLCGYSKRKWQRVRSGENHLKFSDMKTIVRVLSEETGEYPADLMDELVYALTLDWREQDSEEDSEDVPEIKYDPDFLNLVKASRNLTIHNRERMP